MQSFKLKVLGVTILQWVKFPIFLLIFEWALKQCSATALPVIFGNLEYYLKIVYLVLVNVMYHAVVTSILISANMIHILQQQTTLICCWLITFYL